jgi:uncharacterized membrane protein AbrB (regulator of aidB expression)
MLLPVLAGVVLGGLFALVAHNHRSPGEVHLLALGLVVAALSYVALALAGADGRWLALEVIGLALFAGLAWLGVRVSLWWLALGWVAHVGWDIGLHLDRTQPVVGGWYPLACVGFDLVVAGFLLSVAQTPRPPRAPAA